MTAVVTPLRRLQPLEAPVLTVVPDMPPVAAGAATTPVTPLRPAPVRRPNLIVIDGGRSAEVARRRAVYRRRRLAVVFGLVIAVAIGVQAAPGFVAAMTTPPDATVAPAPAELAVDGSTYVARPGDTLWDVAVALDAGGDVRDVVQRLAEVNDVERLVVGQAIRIPADLRAS